MRESYKTLHSYCQQLKSCTIPLLSQWNMEAAFIENERGAAICEFQVLFATSVDSVLTRASRVMLNALTKLLTIPQVSQTYKKHQPTKVISLS